MRTKRLEPEGIGDGGITHAVLPILHVRMGMLRIRLVTQKTMKCTNLIRIRYLFVLILQVIHSWNNLPVRSHICSHTLQVSLVEDEGTYKVENMGREVVLIHL